MTDEMMVAIVVDSLIDDGLCDISDFDRVGKMILKKLNRYKSVNVSSQSVGDFNREVLPDIEFNYSNHYVENEKTKTNSGDKLNNEYVVEHTPVVSGTLTGIIYRKTKDRDSDGKNGVAIQTFVANEKGEFTFTNVNDDNLKVKAIRGNVIHNTGEVLLEWTEVPGPNVCVFSYEYKQG